MSNPFLKQVFNKDKTFRPKRKFEPGTQRFELHKRAQASLNAGLDLRLAVQLPLGEDLNDWVAVHVVDFFNRVNLIYGTISDGCTEQSCPVMSGGPKYEYRWQDEQRYRKPTALSAPRYMDLLMDWIEVQINNEDIFPTNVGESRLHPCLLTPMRGPATPGPLSAGSAALSRKGQTGSAGLQFACEYYYFLCVSTCTTPHAGARGGQHRLSATSAGVPGASELRGLLGTGLGSSAHAFNHWAFSLVLHQDDDDFIFFLVF